MLLYCRFAHECLDDVDEALQHRSAAMLGIYIRFSVPKQWDVCLNRASGMLQRPAPVSHQPDDC